MRLPYPRWWLALLWPLNNRYTWRLRLRILTAFDPPSFKYISNLVKNHGSSYRKPIRGQG